MKQVLEERRSDLPPSFRRDHVFAWIASADVEKVPVIVLIGQAGREQMCFDPHSLAAEDFPSLDPVVSVETSHMSRNIERIAEPGSRCSMRNREYLNR